MASHYEAPIRNPLIVGDKTYHDVTVDVARPVEGKANRLWWIVFSVALAAFLWGLGCIVYTVSTGIGVWGLNKTVGWAWDITNFVWWVGIGHAGTLISAVLLLFRQKWRMAINRSAEAMTIFSVVQAGDVRDAGTQFAVLQDRRVSSLLSTWDALGWPTGLCLYQTNSVRFG